MKNNQVIIISTLLMLTASFFFLTAQEYLAKSKPNQGWWSVSFSDPDSSDLTFEIKNYTENDNFRWEMLVDQNKVSDGTTTAATGKSTKVPAIANDIENKKITVIVLHGEEKKEIYKNF